ncbi:hypothetical protein [Candidatus Cardinium hertigii]|uniref:Uncharacterized protein n=1 Tax=Candidatus Cardinium hertigii TaxID=247481 RepID=A0A2Z3L7W0_9BACT|nr:hypothetical protein [Candidatus Cardinium hertigii]AWN81541.1 hypothetical protein DK880_00209 [Candidatus Cardinium hertigii]
MHWLLFIQTNFIPLEESLLTVVFPLLLSWIPIYLWLNPSIKLLNLSCSHLTLRVVAWLVIGLPTIFAQDYLVKATSKLTQLDNITLFEKSAPKKYYSLDHYYIDKTRIGIKHTTTSTGRRNETLDLCIYVTLPILTNWTDIAKREYPYWLGKKYTKTISNRLSDQEKEFKWNAFYWAGNY